MPQLDNRHMQIFTGAAGPALVEDSSTQRAVEDGSALQAVGFDPSAGAAAGSLKTVAEIVAVQGAAPGQTCDTSTVMPGSEAPEKTVAILAGAQLLDVIQPGKRPMDMSPERMAAMCMKWRNISIQEVCNETLCCVAFAYCWADLSGIWCARPSKACGLF